MRRNKVLLGLSVLLIAKSVAICPAPAADLKSIFTSIVSISDIDGKQAQIERRIQEAQSSGQLSAQESQSFKRELDRISETEAAYKSTDSTLSPWESLKLMLELDTLSKLLEAKLHDRKTTSTESSLTTRKLDLIKRIEDGHGSGRLTDQEYNELKYEFGRIAELENSFRKSNGTLNPAELLKLSLDLDHISNKLERQMHDRQISLGSVERKRSDLEKLVHEGVASGKLSQAEGDSMGMELHKMAERINALKNVHRPLTTDESLTLVLALEKITSQLDAQLNKTPAATTDIDNKRTDLDRRIADALSNGKIVLSEAQVLQNDLAGIEQRVKEARDSQGNINELTKQRILIDLERLNNRLVRKLVWEKPVWPGIQATITELGKNIAGATTDSRISNEEAATLRQELERISTQKSSFLSSENALNAKEAISLAADLDKLSLRVERSMNDRDLVAPEIDERQFQLDARLAEGIKNGKLTVDEASKFLQQMDRISSREAGFRGTDGRLDAREKVLLALDLERTGSAIEKDLSRGIVGQTMDERRKTLDQRLTFGTSTGRLSSAESEKARAELSRIKTLESQYAASGTGLDASETLVIASELDKLNGVLDQQIKDKDMALPDVDRRQAELRARIEEGVNTGRLTLEEAKELKKQFDKIAELEQKYASGGLSFGEHANLALELERLSSNIEHQMRDQQVALPDVYAHELAVDQKLADLVVAGKITLEQAADLRLQLDVVQETEKSFRISGGGLSYPESLTLIAELDRISKVIDTKINKKTTNDFETQFAKVTTRITGSELAVKAKPQEVANLKKELERIAQAKTAFAHSGGGLSYAEAESLLRDVDRLNKEIDSRLGAGKAIAWSDIAARQKKLGEDIARGVTTGKIKSNDAKQLRKELDQLNTAKTAFTNSDGSLNYYETISLAQALDRLDAMVKKQLQ